MKSLMGIGRIAFAVLTLTSAVGGASAQTKETSNLEGTWSYDSGSVLIRARAGDTLELYGHDSVSQWESRCMLKVAKQFRCVGTGVIFGSSEGKEKQNIPFIIRSTMTFDGDTVKDEWETEPLVGKKGMSRTDILKRMK
jgi:hypothetical protein